MVVAVAFGAVTVRLLQLQVLAPDAYAARGMAQRLHQVVLPAERGSIFDRNGAELAMSVNQTTVWADPRQIADPAAAALALAPILGLPVAEVEASLRREASFVYVVRQIGDELASAVEALDLDGIHLLDESKRFAPAGGLAASILGETDIDNLGLSGLEAKYEQDLVGDPGSLSIERARDGATIAGGAHEVTPSQRGLDLVLTIDRSLQYEVERALADQLRSTGAEAGTAIVMDPTTGEILAMANLGLDGEGNPVPLRENRAVTVPFEPGSVNKVITIAGALEEGLVEPSTVLTVPDSYRLSVKTFTDHDRHAPTPWSVTDIVSQSSNVGTIMLAQQLGQERFAEYLTRFGLGRASGLGFPGETKGIMRDDWSGTDMGSIPIGQGISVTALQMLQVYNTIANGGVWVQPSLVRSTVDGEGREQAAPEPERRRVVSEATAAELTAMLANVVTNGTGVNATISGYTVAGKTGTARKPDGVRGGYEPGAYFSSFAGFVPAESPRLSALVVLDEPRPTYYAGIVSAPVFSKISQYALRQFRVPPPATDRLLADVPAAGPVPVELQD